MHIITYGSPRIATSLLFNMVAISFFIYLTENDPEKIVDVDLIFWLRPNGYKTLKRKKTSTIIETHLSLDNFL